MNVSAPSQARSQASRSYAQHHEARYCWEPRDVKGAKASHAEEQTGKGDQVDGELAQVGDEVDGEAEAAGDAGHGGGHKVVQVTVDWGSEIESAEADIVEDLVGVLDQLMHGQGGIVGLDNSRHFGRGED